PLDGALALLALARAPAAQAGLDHVLGRLGDDAPLRVEPLAPGAAGDLLEVADRKGRDLLAVELRELGEEDGADRDVHPDAESVRARDDAQEPLLRELLDEEAIFGQQAGVMDADAEREIAPELLAVRGVEAGVADQLADPLALLAGRDLHAGERLGELRTLALREVDDVDRRLAGFEQALDRLVERRLA